jgi:hypothetical protein
VVVTQHGAQLDGLRVSDEGAEMSFRITLEIGGLDESKKVLDDVLEIVKKTPTPNKIAVRWEKVIE